MLSPHCRICPECWKSVSTEDGKRTDEEENEGEDGGEGVGGNGGEGEPRDD